MREDHRFRKQKGLTPEQKKLIPLGGLLALAVVLAVVIVSVERKEQAARPVGMTEAAETETMREQTPEEAETEASREEETEAPEELFKNHDPEILALMNRYFQARAMGDAKEINAVYGITDVSEKELQSQSAKLLNNAKYISSISDVAVYVVDGTAADNWLVYTTAEIKFYIARIKTPMIMWCYVTKDAEGNYRLLDNNGLSTEMLEYVEAVNRKEPVRQLAADINARMKEAISSDEGLAEAYGVLYQGSQVWDGSRKEEDVVVVEKEEDTNER